MHKEGTRRAVESVRWNYGRASKVREFLKKDCDIDLQEGSSHITKFAMEKKT